MEILAYIFVPLAMLFFGLSLLSYLNEGNCTVLLVVFLVICIVFAGVGMAQFQSQNEITKEIVIQAELKCESFNGYASLTNDYVICKNGTKIILNGQVEKN